MRSSLAFALALVLTISAAVFAGPDKKGGPRPKVTRPAAAGAHHGTPPKATGRQRPAGGSHRAAPPKVARGTTAHGTTTVRGTTTAHTTTIPTALPRNPKLVARLQALLPAGTDINLAALGFRNQGQFVAAVHVSRNLGIPFSSLKAKMVDEGVSLGQAIQNLRPRADATGEVRRAEFQASEDLAPKAAKTKRRP